MDMTTAQPKKGVLASSADFDWGEAAGPMQGATSWTPSENAQASSQLSKILQSDSPLMVAARSGAERAAARRGLLSSSISAGAGQEAMVNTATPIATQDANTWAQSQRDGAQAANDFARDANAFGRQKAMTQYQGILAREAQDSDQSFRRGESALDRDFTLKRDDASRAFTTSERVAAQDFSAGQTKAAQEFTASQSAADRALQTDLQNGRITADAAQNQLNRDQQLRIQELTEKGMDRRQAESIAANEKSQREQNLFSAKESDLNRKAAAEEGALSRKAASDEGALNRAHSEAMTRLTAQLNQDAAKANIPQSMVADMSARMSSAVQQILADPNMDGPAKDAAIANYYKYANTQMQWMANFYGTTTPNFMGGESFKPAGSSTAAPPPAAAPAPASPAGSSSSPTVSAPVDPSVGVMGDGDPRDYAWQRWRTEV